LFANSTLSAGIFTESIRERELPKLLTPLNEIFQQQPFILGDEFSVADVAVGSMLCYMPTMLKIDVSAYPTVVEYIQRLCDRPAFKKSVVGDR
jgi:glutathione S-transferase